jgi:uncharacterized membrane protein (DUF485 family)
MHCERRMKTRGSVRDKTQGLESVSASASKWDRIAAMPDFKRLMKTKRAFIIKAFVCFVAYYFAFLILVAFAPKMMSRAIFAPINLACIFAVSEFAAGWIIAWRYLRAARRFDRMAKEIVAECQELSEIPE